MELGAHVWLRSGQSQWGWVPAVITRKDEGEAEGLPVINLTLQDDPHFEETISRSSSVDALTSGVEYGMETPPRGDLNSMRRDPSMSMNPGSSSVWSNRANGGGLELSETPPNTLKMMRSKSAYYADQDPFEIVLTVDPEQLKSADHEDIKLRNLPRSFQLSGEDPEAGVIASPSTRAEEGVVGGVDDLIGLTHLHEPAILHALRLRYDSDIIYTSTGPILIAVNPFKAMGLYSDEMMERYREQGERGAGGAASNPVNFTPFNRRKNSRPQTQENKRLPPHAYQTADDAYRAMMRGLENSMLMGGKGRARSSRREGRVIDDTPTNQSILVSGESGAGKTVTTKIVLNYFAMLSKKQAEAENAARENPLTPLKRRSGVNSSLDLTMDEDVSIEQQVLQSNPILESFGNARTIRNDNSSRFGKYIDIRFTPSGKLSGASIETYLLEKVRLIHPSAGERNYHVFYQFLSSATETEREEFYLGELGLEDFKLLSQTDTYDRRDGVSDDANHQEMLDAMITIGFAPETVQSLMRLIVAVLFAGNMTFTPTSHDEGCVLDETEAAMAVASLLGVTFNVLSSALTTRVIKAGFEMVNKPLSLDQATKALEALIKAVYGAAFNFIVEKVNESIDDHTSLKAYGYKPPCIGVLDIFGFETFDVNNFEQICINYTNEALQQQFNKYVFKLEQKEYEREGILWKFISFPDNQDVLDLIDKKHTGILALLDEQCIVPKSTDHKFTRYLYSKCDHHQRFSASSSQRVDYKFSIEHYAGPVEYNTDSWLEKNKDQLPAATAEVLSSSDFSLISEIRRFVRSEERNGRGTVATKSVGAQFSSQLRTLRERIDQTVPHYIRCLKPNDDLVPNLFDPKNIVEQLRCGGVLEAVRVSRAGYPTRYPHDVFMARYYILGDNVRDERGKIKSISPPNAISLTSNPLKQLVAKIAFDVWEADHKMMMALLEAEKLREEMSSPKFVASEIPSTAQKPQSYDGPPSLAVQHTAMTPKEKRKARNSRMSLAASLNRERQTDSNSIARPETEEEFLSLDFPSRCAVAGLQLGKSKVFLRREAFDRIEAMRSQVFFGAATAIQTLVRGKMCRVGFTKMRSSSIKIQSIMRVVLSKRRTEHLRLAAAATKIQSTWRMASTKWTVYKCFVEMKNAASIIQRAYRAYKTRLIARLGIQNPAAAIIQARFKGVQYRKYHRRLTAATIRIQSFQRGRNIRMNVLDATDEKKRQAFVTADLARVAEEVQQQVGQEITPRKMEIQNAPFEVDPNVASEETELYRYIQEENWAMVENILDKNPELAEQVEPSSGELPLHVIARHAGAWTLLIDMVLVLYPKALIHRDRSGALPIHHASAHDNLAALEIIHSAYKEGINDIDLKGRLPIHVASEFDAVDAVKFLLAKSPEGAFTMVHRPEAGSGGGLPLHVACRNYASIGVITALLAENFASAKRADENGDLPLHLLLRCGEVVDQVVVKTLLTCFSNAVSRTDMNGDLPLSIALKHQCKPAVVNTLMMQFPDAAGILNGDGHSALFLSFQHYADDRTILGLLNHAPELSTAVDKKTGLLPIQVATSNEHSHFIVHNLLKRDMPIDLKEKVRAQLLPHHYSWNHVVSNTDDMYHQVVSKLLSQCTQPQVLALAHVEGPDGKIALASATPVCKHELRVMLRLFNTLEVVNQRPAYTNPISDTQIFYALRYEPPPQQSGAFTVLHEDKKDDALADYVEDWDDTSQVSAMSRNSIRSTLSSRSQQSIEEKLRFIKKEKGQQVIAKLTSRSDVVERELKVRKEYHLSRHYVPAIISVHHTVQHAAYSEAMAEPGYCITMEGADTTAENLMLDMRKSGKRFPAKALKRIGISLLHMHEHGIVHCDFGTHNIGKFGSRWKLLGVGGSVPLGDPTDPNRGFYHPPESIVVESKRAPLGKKAVSACVVSIPAKTAYDIWAYGVVVYEALAGFPLSPYACRGKRAMSENEVGKIGRWDEQSLKKAMKQIEGVDENGRDLIKRLLHYDPEKRIGSMRVALEHPFFGGGGSSGDGKGKSRSHDSTSVRSGQSSRRSHSRASDPANHSLSGGSKSGASQHIPKEGPSSVSGTSRTKSTGPESSRSRSSRHSAPAQIPDAKKNGHEIPQSQNLKVSLSEGGIPDEENVENGVVPSSDRSIKNPHHEVVGESSVGGGSKKSSKSFTGFRNTLRTRMRPSGGSKHSAH